MKKQFYKSYKPTKNEKKHTIYFSTIVKIQIIKVSIFRLMKHTII